jgi:hypothetical protein
VPIPFRNCGSRFVISYFDERSMVGYKIPAAIDKRLREIRPENQDMIFGDFIILISDHFLLPPVFNQPLFSFSRPGGSPDELLGLTLYMEFRNAVVLSIPERQSGKIQNQSCSVKSQIRYEFGKILLLIRNDCQHDV